MGVFRQFPYSNFHEMNMDEIIKIVKNMLEDWATYHAEWDAWMEQMNDDWSNYQDVMNEAWQDMQDFINDYFDNLDVQNEINHKITSMVNSGEFATIVAPYIPPRVTEWLTEHITQPVGVVIDTSLTVAGACADAKATGDAITEVQNTLTDYERNGIGYGENLCDGHIIQGTRNTDGILVIDPPSNTSVLDKIISITPEEKYTVRVVGVSSIPNFRYYLYEDGELLSTNNVGTVSEYEFTAPEGCNGFSFQSGSNTSLIGEVCRITLASEKKPLYEIIKNAKHSIINVLDYGAVGDGETSDSTAIANAISASNDGDTIYFPKGTYLITQKIYLHDKSLNFVGDGAGLDKYGINGITTLLRERGNASVDAVIVIDSTASFSMKDMCINANACSFEETGIEKSSSVSGNIRSIVIQDENINGITFANNNDVTIDNCRFTRASGNGIVCGTFCHVSNTKFYYCNIGIYLPEPDSIISNCGFLVCTRGVEINENAVSILNCRFDQMAQYAISCIGDLNIISGCLIDSADYCGIYVLGDSNKIDALINRCGRFYALWDIDDVPTEDYRKATNIFCSGTNNILNYLSTKGSYSDLVASMNTPPLSSYYSGENNYAVCNIRGFGIDVDIAVQIADSIQRIRYSDVFREIVREV